jgi:hypothetical protein
VTEASGDQASPALRFTPCYVSSHTRCSIYSHWWGGINSCSLCGYSSPCGVLELGSLSDIAFSRLELNISRQRVSSSHLWYRIVTLSTSVGNSNSQELRRGRNETWCSGLELAESDEFAVRLMDLTMSFRESRDRTRSPKILIRVSLHLSSVPRHLILLQQSTVVPFHRVFHRPRYPGSHVTVPIMNIETFVRVRTTDLPLSRAFLSFEQDQHMVYREVLIAGDLSREDVDRATAQLGAFQVSQAIGLSTRVPTLSRVLPKRGPCSRMAQASQITPSFLTATKPCISPNQVSRNSSLAVLGLVFSMSIELRH